MSRQVYLLGWGLALVAGAFLLTEALLWRPGVTEANVRRVKPGMKLEQITAIFGRNHDGGISFGGPVGVLTWDGGRIRFSARFSADGILEDYRIAPRRDVEAPINPLAHLCAWLGW